MPHFPLLKEGMETHHHLADIQPRMRRL